MANTYEVVYLDDQHNKHLYFTSSQDEIDFLTERYRIISIEPMIRYSFG